MITFDDIIFANQSIKTTDIKGKEYAEVNQRIKAFRMVYPTGFIRTKIYDYEKTDGDAIITMTADVGYVDENGYNVCLATGTAQEKESSSYINKTSFVENCETSAVGRALGMAGFGIDVSVASYEEVQNAIANQNAHEGKEPTINKHEFDMLKKMYSLDEIKQMYKELGITRGTDMPLEYFTQKSKEYDAKFKEEHPEKQFY